jgi:8-oxo-dGTP diphosphatase
MSVEKFNIRVYGLLINERDEVLISDECRNGFSFTKFPGGGVEVGEGFPNALRREFMEELGIEIEVGDLFFFNDYYQVSVFNPNHQVVSFYYVVQYANWHEIETDQHVVPITEEGEKHRWISRALLDQDLFMFPIDKIVAKRLSEKEK